MSMITELACLRDDVSEYGKEMADAFELAYSRVQVLRTLNTMFNDCSKELDEALDFCDQLDTIRRDLANVHAETCKALKYAKEHY